MLTYVILALGMLSLTAFLIIRVKKCGVESTLLKTLTSAFFILTAIVAFVSNESVSPIFAGFILFGLVMGLIGDIVLDLKVNYPADSDKYLYGGMSAFAVGHVSYMVAIYMSFSWNLVTLLVPMAIAVVLALGAVFSGPLMGLKYGKFTLPSLIYAFLLSFMMFASGAAAISTNFSTLWVIMFVGAVLFLISDLILSQSYFTVKEEKDGEGKVLSVSYPKAKTPVLVITNHITYYAAQFLIALSILFF